MGHQVGKEYCLNASPPQKGLQDRLLPSLPRLHRLAQAEEEKPAPRFCSSALSGATVLPDGKI